MPKIAKQPATGVYIYIYIYIGLKFSYVAVKQYVLVEVSVNMCQVCGICYDDDEYQEA